MIRPKKKNCLFPVTRPSLIKTSRFKFFFRLCPTLFFFPLMNIAAKIAAEIEAVRLFYHDRPVFTDISAIWHPIGTMVTFMECSRKYASNSMLDITIVSKLGVLDIVFWLATYALISNSRYFGTCRNRGYLGHMTSNWDNGYIYGMLSKIRF